MIRKLKALYADRGIVVRTRVPGVFFVLVLICAVLPVALVNDIIVGDYTSFGLVFTIWLTMVFSLFMLFRGHYRFASNFPLVIALLGMTALSMLLDFESSYQVHTVMFYMVLPLVLSLVVSESEWHTLATRYPGLCRRGIYGHDAAGSCPWGSESRHGGPYCGGFGNLSAHAHVRFSDRPGVPAGDAGTGGEQQKDRRLPAGNPLGGLRSWGQQRSRGIHEQGLPAVQNRPRTDIRSYRTPE